jgi:hypothetical protein
VEVAGGWIKVHNEKFYNLYTPPNIIKAIKSRSIAGHVARTEETKCVQNFFEKLERKRPL